jgi:hypothetical protein
MFRQIQASDRTKPVKPQYWAIITDELWVNKLSGMLGRLLAYQPSKDQAIAQMRQLNKQFPEMRTRVVSLRAGNLPFRHYIDPKLHLAPDQAPDRYGRHRS